MTDSISSQEALNNALAVIKASGYSVAEATAAHEQAMAALRDSRRQPEHRCHRCGGTPTHQWTRRATDQEAEAWHAAREQHIRAHNDGRAAAGYVSDRSDVVTLAVHGCDEHNLTPVPDEPVDSSPEALGAVNFAAQDAGAALRALLHDADCGGHGACGCGGGDG